MWNAHYAKRMPSLKNPVLLTGLPGIGNVSKIAVDLMIDTLKLPRVVSFFSPRLPNAVFIGESDLAQLPSLQLHALKSSRRGGRDILLLAGDIQPPDEESCYTFCDTVLDAAQKLGCTEVITLGGIALQRNPETPRLYATGCKREHVTNFIKGTDISPKLFGFVGPIMGVSGVLMALAARRGMSAVTLLAETSADPAQLGIPASKAMLSFLNKRLSVGLTPAQLSSLREVEEEVARHAKDLAAVAAPARDEATYIG